MEKVVIVGAGPIGLAAAAHVLERNMEPLVLEAGPSVGHAVSQWAHVKLFSPWAYNLDKASVRLLRSAGWRSPDPSSFVTGGELVREYLEPLAKMTPLLGVVRLSSRVVAITRVGLTKMKSTGRAEARFEVAYETGAGQRRVEADAVIDASGTYFTPNPAGANGVPADGEQGLSKRIRYGFPDVLGLERERYAGKTVAVLGSGHSAIGVLLDLAALSDRHSNTKPVWIWRKADPTKIYGRGPKDRLSERAKLGQAFADLLAAGEIVSEPDFQVRHIAEHQARLLIAQGPAETDRYLWADQLIVCTGFRPELSFLRELRLRLDPATEAPVGLAPLIDPEKHTCGTVKPHGARELSHDEPGFYIAGMKSYGRAPTFLMMTGYEQIRSIVAELAGDLDAAARTELTLPSLVDAQGDS